MFPRFHSTPPEVVAETLREVVFIDDYTFQIERPVDSDRLLDHPWVRSVYAADQYVPYWPTLWPAARMLAKAVVREPWEKYPRPVNVLEIGCGLGLSGVACLARGLNVTFSDVDETALSFAALNARLNGFTTGFRTMSLDLRAPLAYETFTVLIGSDLMYEDRLVEPLIEALRAVLAADGVCLIADPDRNAARIFKWKLEESGYNVTTSVIRAGEPGGERTRGTLYRIRHR